MATESTESTDPHTPLTFGFHPAPLRSLLTSVVCRLDEIVAEEPGDDGKKHKEKGVGWVFRGFRGYLGWGGRARLIR